MKVKIKTYNGELPDYLTAEKTYPVLKKITINGQVFFNIISDSKNMISVCSHDLNGGSWEFVE